MAEQFQKTTNEYRAAAMLLDMSYDPESHLIFNYGVTLCLDPDTLETLYDDREVRKDFKAFIEPRRLQFARYQRR